MDWGLQSNDLLSGWTGWRSLPAIFHMSDCQNRMVPEHPWSGITHNFFDLGAHRWLVAVDRALTASRFVLLITTSGQSIAGIGGKGATFGTQPFLAVMMRSAVECDHGLNGLPLSTHSGFSVMHQSCFLSL